MSNRRYASCCLFLVASLPLMATSVTTTSYSTWNSSSFTSGGVTTSLTFAGLSGSSWNTSAGVSDGGYIFTGPDSSSWSLSKTFVNGAYGLEGASDGVGGILLSLPGSGQNAFFLTVSAEQGQQAVTSGSVNMTLSDGETFTIAPASGNTSGTYLFGISIPHPVTTVLLTPTASNQGVFLEEVDFAASSLAQDQGTGNGSGGGSDPSQTPEAATLALVGGGILIVARIKRSSIRKFAI